MSAPSGDAPKGRLAVGQQVSHYTVLSLLGAGGMGEVYRAYDQQLQRDVAIKVLFDGPSGGSSRGRLLREARSAAALNHPHICTIYEVGEADGQAYIAMELIEGRPLNQVIPAAGLPVNDVLRYGLEIADAVAHAHERGVIHRDLKTINTLVTTERRVKVLDFGLAKRVNTDDLATVSMQSVSLTSDAQTVTGTLPYMAPEQLRGLTIDERSDVWALGVVLYEMAVGVRPFHGATMFDLSAAIVSQPMPPLSTKVPRRLTTVIERCLQKDPSERYANGGEVRDALAAVRESSFGTEGVAAPAARFRGRERAVAVVLAVGVVAAGGAWFMLTRTTSAPPGEVQGTIRPLTSYVGWELAPSWSPDGSQVAYTQVVGGSADVAVISRGGEPHVLTTSPADEFLPRWSPKGARIAFVSDRGTGTNVYWIPASGGAEHKVAETHIPFLQRMSAWAGALGATPWSPDETRILFSRLQPTGEVAIWKITLETGEERQLTTPPAGAEDTDAAWSFDGRSIAFTRSAKGLSSLWRVSPDGGGESVLFDEGPVNASPAWTPDGGRLIFQSVMSGAMNLWELELRSRKAQRLTFGPGSDIWAAVSRDGSIVYGQYGHEVHVYEARVDAPEQSHEQLTSFTGENFAPRVSRDGALLYTSTRAGNNDIWLLDRKTGMHRNLTDNPASDRLADWSPDGKDVVFMSDRGGAVKLWVASVDTGIARQLTDQEIPWSGHAAEAEGGPRWSPDGKRIAYLAPLDKDMAIWVVDPDGKNAHSTAIRDATSFSWYKDDNRLLYTRRAPDGSGRLELRAAHLVTGEDRLLRTGAIAEIAAPPDGHALSFIDAVSHFTMELYVLRLTPTSRADQLPQPDREPQRITSGNGQWHSHAGGWSADGRSLVYSRDRDFGDIYTIESRK